MSTLSTCSCSGTTPTSSSSSSRWSKTSVEQLNQTFPSLRNPWPHPELFYLVNVLLINDGFCPVCLIFISMFLRRGVVLYSQCTVASIDETNMMNYHHLFMLKQWHNEVNEHYVDNSFSAASSSAPLPTTILSLVLSEMNSFQRDRPGEALI